MNSPGKTEGSPNVWIFQANPKYFYIFEALQKVDRITFRVTRHRERIAAGDETFLWISGKQAGIYAKAHIADGVKDISVQGPYKAFWVDPDGADEFQPSAVLVIDKRYLSNPILKTRLQDHPQLRDLGVIRQPNATVFRVTQEQWEALKPMLPTQETHTVDPTITTLTQKRTRQRRAPQIQVIKETLKPPETPAVFRHRQLLEHLSKFGEITPSEESRLGIPPEDLIAWLEALLLVRPLAKVVSPLFLWAAEGETSSVNFTTRLTIKMLGDNFETLINTAIVGIEEYVWESFGAWHLSSSNVGDVSSQRYLSFPTVVTTDQEALQKQQLFSTLPQEINFSLIRNANILTELQQWSAKSEIKGLGPLSRQLKLGISRPLFLSHYQLPEIALASTVDLQNFPESEVNRRHYVIAGLPLCSSEEFVKGERLSGEEIVERLLEHPLYSAIVQFEIHRLMASISRERAAQLFLDQSGEWRLEVGESREIPLWRACRTLLEDLGFKPVTWSVQDSSWERAVSQAIINLENLQVLERHGENARLKEIFASKIKAHPGHPQNRGEKDFRVRLLKYLENF